MATSQDTQKLVLEMSADLNRWNKSLEAAQRASQKRLTAIERQFQRSSRNVVGSANRMASDVNRAIATIAVGAAIHEVAAYADAWTNARNKLAAAGTATEDLGRRQGELVDLANRTRSGFEETVDLYAKMTRNAAQLGATQIEVARATEIVNKSFKAGGANAQEQAAAITQLGQALGSGVLQGDELRSLRENAPLLAKAIADEFGVTIGGLKKLGEEGKLSSERVFQAILKGGAAIDAQFAKTTPTIADSFKRLQNEATRFVGELDKATGATQALTLFVGYLADNIDTLTDAAVVAASVIGGALAGQAIIKLANGSIKAAAALGLTRAAIKSAGLGAASAAAGMNALRAAMAFLGGPWGVLITAVAIAVAFLTVQLLKKAEADRETKKTTTALDKATQDYTDAVASLIGKTKEERDEILKTIAVKKKLLEQERANTREKLTSARATLAQIQAENAATLQKGFDPEGAGGQAVAMGKRQEQASANVAALNAAISATDSRIKELDAVLNAKPGGAGGEGTDKPDKKATGKTAAELAAMREMLALRAKLDAAQAAGDLDTSRALEAQIDLRDRIKAYEDAGLKTAAATKAATADQAAIQEGVTKAQGDAVIRKGAEVALARYELELNAQAVRDLTSKIELQDRIKSYQEDGLDLATATNVATAEQLQLDKARAAVMSQFLEDSAKDHELRVAQLANDRERIKILEREMAIRERARELEESGGLSPKDARGQATNERREEETADLKGKFKAAFSEGVKAAFEGDLEGFLRAKAGDFATALFDKSIDQAADLLFDQAVKMFPKLFDFGEQVTAATTSATIMSTAITAGSATGAAAMGAAIVAAGATAGATMAAAIAAAAAAGSTANATGDFVTAAFSGMRAAGGSIRKGGRYMMQDREPIIPTSSAAVLSGAAMAGLAHLSTLAQSGRLGGRGDINLEVINNTGVPARAETTQTSDGARLSLEPLADQMLDAAGRSGKLRSSLNKSPPRRRRG